MPLTNIPKGKKQPLVDALKAVAKALDDASVACTFAHRPGLGMSMTSMRREILEDVKMINNDKEDE